MSTSTALEAEPVPSPGNVLFHKDARLAELQSATPAQRQLYCGARWPDWSMPSPVRYVRDPEGRITDRRPEPFSLLVMQGSAAWFGARDRGARDAVLRAMSRWAERDGLERGKHDRPAAQYTLNRVALPAIVGWSLIRDSEDVSAETRSLIDQWLLDLVAINRHYVTTTSPDAINARNNHRYLAASVRMAWGALTGNETEFIFGIETFTQALAAMRPDGSLPLETDRGKRALWYQRHAIGSLVMVAEMAAVQGIDLYGVKVNDVTIHDAVRFLSEALLDDAILEPYLTPDAIAAQDLGFLVERGHGRHYMAWVEAYLRRFPDLQASVALRSILAQQDEVWRPMYDEFAGGNATCFFAPLGEVQDLAGFMRGAEFPDHPLAGSIDDDEPVDD